MKQHFTRLTCYLCLLLISTVPIGRTYAKYATTASSGENSARVAAWVVEVNSTVTDLTVDAAGTDTDTYSFTVSNNKDGKTCEVDFTYDVVVETTSSFENISTLMLKKDEKEVPVFKNNASTDNNQYIYRNVGSFNAGTIGTDYYNLTISGYTGDTFDSREVKVYVVATQTD